MAIDLDILEASPTFDERAIVVITALAPLSLVDKMPGKYYRSRSEPSEPMLLGLLENALGWHFTQGRTDILKRLKAKHKLAPAASGSGFSSLLQFHVRFKMKEGLKVSVMRYDDLWSQHLNGPSFVGGSRNYDSRAIPLMDAVAGKRVTISDRTGATKDADAVDNVGMYEVVHLGVLKPYFPQYYVSPTSREYIVPDGPYCYEVSTSAALASILSDAIRDPAAPLYLGSNDGWVDADWHSIR